MNFKEWFKDWFPLILVIVLIIIITILNLLFDYPLLSNNDDCLNCTKILIY